MPDEVYFSTCSHADVVEMDNTTIYDSPTQCLNLHTIPEEGEKEQGEEEGLDYHNPTYEALDYVTAEYEVAVQSMRPPRLMAIEQGAEEKLDIHNPTYEVLDCSSAECEVVVQSQPTLLESATFDDEIYSKIN